MATKETKNIKEDKTQFLYVTKEFEITLVIPSQINLP